MTIHKIYTTIQKEELEAKLAERKIKKGDRIKIYSESDTSAFGIMLILFFIGYALFSDLSKEVKRKKISQLQKSKSQDELEKIIEKEGEISIDIEEKPTPSYDPFEDSFGIWKNKDITIEKIRQRAWQKTT